VIEMEVMPVQHGLVIRPGDHVLITTREARRSDVDMLRSQLLREFPGVKFTVVAGVTGLAKVEQR
jgi:ribosomal protein S12